jgi:hypothetical protein
MEGNIEIPKKFTTPDDEIAFLRQELSRREQESQIATPEKPLENIAHELVKEYSEMAPEHTLAEEIHIQEHEAEAVALRLSPEEHDEQIGELYGVMLEKGVRNTLTVIEKMKNPHIEDDFHRFLVQYIKAGHPVSDVRPGQELWKAINMTLFEVTLPAPENGESKPYREFVTLMEQFYAGMLSVGSEKNNKEKNYYTIEVALSQKGEDVIFYVSVPNSKIDLFQKQVFGLYRDAKIEEIFDDYNIFHESGSVAGAYAKPTTSDVLSLKTHDLFDHDPISVLLNTFSKMKRVGEGASFQIVIVPAGQTLVQEYGIILDHMKKGESLSTAVKSVRSLAFGFFKVGKELFSAFKDDGKNKDDARKQEDRAKTKNEGAIESLGKKLGSTIVETNIRIIASAETRERSQDILHELVSSFNQFNDTKGNGFDFVQPKGSELDSLIRSFTFRTYNPKHMFTLNLQELATIYHFPIESDGSPQLKQSKAGGSPASADFADVQGILLGLNKYRGRDLEIRMDREDRVRHTYVIGQTGTGKTTIMKNMIAQDIRNGDGCCFIDPHGTDVQEILSYVPKERIDDVIYFDPAYMARPMGLNMLEFDPNYPEQKTFVINELMGIFGKLFDMKAGGGAMFEQYFRNSTGLVMEHPESGSTLLEIGRVLSDKAFRDMKLSHCKNPLITQFWKNAEATTGEQGLENFVPYITSKFDGFLSNEIMRPIVTQEKSAFNFRKIMDEKKILLVNLAKGRLGEINANLIGMILVGKIQMAALSRVDMYGQKMNDFYLYIDEFQNVTTDSIASILSEARKYRLSLNIAHQYIAQLEEKIRDAVFGNVGSMAVYRVSPEDAEFLAKKYAPTFTPTDIMKLDNFNSYVSMLLKGVPAKPFNMECHWSIIPPGDKELAEKIKQLSYLKYGRPREEVEAEFVRKLQQN